VPFAGEVLKRVAGNGLALAFLLFLDRRRIDSLVELGLCLVAAGAGVPQGNGGVFAEAEELGLALEAIGHAPELASGRGDIEEEAFAVEVLFRSGFGFQIADLGFCQRHVGSPWIYGVEEIPTRTQKALFYNLLTCVYRDMHSTFIPTDIPTKKLDANARRWISPDAGNRLKQRIPNLYWTLGFFFRAINGSPRRT
jgi:hypothetical protein